MPVIAFGDIWHHIVTDFSNIGTPAAFTAFVQVLLIDVVLAGDNAIVVGALAAGLPDSQRKKVIFIGVLAALVLRLIFALTVSWVLGIVGLVLAGGTGRLGFLERVAGEIRSRLPEGRAGIEEVAAALDLARWTLQRRLAEQGVSYSALTERVRRDLACLHLRQRHMPVADIGFMLGYSEISAFSRAFSRWTGLSPQAYRQKAPCRSH